MGFFACKVELYCSFSCARGSLLVPFALAGPASPMQRVCRILKMLRDKNESAKGIIALVLNNTTRQSWWETFKMLQGRNIRCIGHVINKKPPLPNWLIKSHLNMHNGKTRAIPMSLFLTDHRIKLKSSAIKVPKHLISCVNVTSQHEQTIV